MMLIIENIGRLDECDLAFISQKNAHDYLKFCQFGKGKRSKDLSENFSFVKNKPLLHLLKGLLQFNPGLRLTAKECL